MFCCLHSDIVLLVYSDGKDYAKYVSIISNGVKKLNHVLQLVKDNLENEKLSAEEQLQLTKICELEDEFVKDILKENWREYFNLDIEKGQLVNLQIDQVIVITYKVRKNLFTK